MNLRIFPILYLLCLFASLNAQIIPVSKKEIQWTGFETWSTDKVSKQVLSFKNAQYPDENELPYFVEKLENQGNANYIFQVVNPVFTPASPQEKNYLSTKGIPSDLKLTSYISTERGQNFTFVQLLPFVKKDNEILKLTSFELQIDKQQNPQKVGAAIHSYAATSVLASGKFVKVKIGESGIYKLTYDALRKMDINPDNVRVFGYGGALLEQSFLISKPDDLPEVAVWKGSDYILFYGQGLTKWSYNKDMMMFTHTLNHYANEGYYFITSDAGVGKKIQDVTINVPVDASVVPVTSFVDYKVHEKEKINLGKTGKVFYGEDFVSTLTYNFPFDFPNLTGDPIKVRIDAAAASSAVSTFNLKLTESPSPAVSFPIQSIGADRYDVGKDANRIFSFDSPMGSKLTFNLTYSKINNNSRGYLNYIEVNAKRNLQMSGSLLFFRNVDNLNTLNYSKFQITVPNSNVQIWDITDQSNIKRITATQTGNLLEFTDSNESVKEYVAIDPTAKNDFTMEPISIGTIANQDIHKLGFADMIIITHPNFVKQAERLAEAHKTKDNLTTHVVTSEQVYNEFSSGTPDATAYRWVMKMFYDRAKAAGNMNLAPRYLLLFGRGSFDNRGLINNSGDNLLLTYQADMSLNLVSSYVTDDYFGLLDDNEGNSVPSQAIDIGIGRFPVVTTIHADNVVDKTIAYMNNDTKGNWKNQLAFIADDGDNSLHISQADSIAQTIFKANPSFQLQKIYLDSYLQEISASGESYPIARKKLHDIINSGAFLINFTGHASPVGWTNEQVLTTADVKGLFNKKLPVWVAATCDFVQFDVKDISAGEFVVLNPVGGGIALLSAARTVYASQNETINRKFTEDLFIKKNGEYPRLGDAFKRAKNGIGTEVNKLTYVLLGDPALKLSYPETYKVVTEKINSVPIQTADTLKALSVNSVEGIVTDLNGNKATDFNGKIEITIYDKIQRISTLNNHQEKNGVYKFFDRPNILYSGKATVKSGEFSFTFMMPRDIRYNYGMGRINYYANDTISGKEGQGYFENFIVGGAKQTSNFETDGPIINMFLNTPHFVSGGKVNETPLFEAHISDINGINTVGSGIGHDLKLVIDDDPATTYTLNENFEAETNSYQAGKVRLKLPPLKEGKHTLTFHAWDLLNNSSQATLEFEVVPKSAPSIFLISNYPNPVKTETTFVIDHDRPEVILDTRIDIFDVTGRLILSKQQNSTDNLKWDLTDSTGGRVRPGIYLYKVSIKTPNSEFTSKANKIIVLGQ